MPRPLRSTFILATAAMCAVLAAVSGWRFARASAPVNGPIVLVSVDALRADRLRAYGYEPARTPAIDGLAADGVLFERAYSHVPQTLPAHAAMLTGRLPFENGVRDSAGQTLSGSARTIAELLRDRGYSTGAAVSSWLLRPGTGIERGFSFFDAPQAETIDADPIAGLLRDGADTEQVAERWLDSLSGTRAFLFMHVAEPHAPHEAPERFDDLDAYDGEVAYADEIVGRLLRYLKAHQLYDRTTILLVGDHGESLGAHGESTHGLLAHEDVLRVPFIIKLPGGQGAGTRVPDAVQQIDIVPTVLDLAKAPGPGGLRGRSLTPFTDGGHVQATPIYAESTFGNARFGWSGIGVLVDGPLKLVVQDARESLFDVAVDPGETRNLASDRPDATSDMRRRLNQLSAGSSAPWSAAFTPAAIGDADRDRFEALGYVALPGFAALAADGGTPDERVALVERLREAALLSARRDWRGAAQVYRELARDRSEAGELWLRAGLASARAERYEQAIDAYTRALALDPDNVRTHLDLASVLTRVRRFDSARDHAAAVLEQPGLEPAHSAEAHELQARIAIAGRDYETARLEAERAEQADAERPVRAFVEGRIALLHAHPAEAAVAFEAALEAAARTRRLPLADLRVLAADALTRLDRRDEAEALLEAELRAFPDSTRARAGLQALDRAAGRPANRPAVAQH
ncbi:MAG: sulfatase-like hydrolase/transferase [Vicinamibacterales bacterium]